MKRYWVYILASIKDGVLYTGVTSILPARVAQHRTRKGSAFSARYYVQRLVYSQEYETAYDAVAAEKLLKKWRRAWKAALIKKGNPEWRDLYETL